MKQRHYPLSVHIASLFLAMATLLGTVIIGVSYRHSEILLEGTAQNLSRENSRKLQSAFKEHVGPVLATLDLMATTPFIEQQDSQSMSWMAGFRLIFQRNSSLVALFYGSNNGDFTLIRPLLTEQSREHFSAPPNSDLLINHTNTSGLDMKVYLDDEQNSIGRTTNRNNQFDPRVRPWFTSVKSNGEITLTKPYFFYFLQANGVTLSRLSASGEHVVAADFTLGSLSEQLESLAYSPRSQLVLLDGDGQLLAGHNLVGIDTSKGGLISTLNDSIFSNVLRSFEEKKLEKGIHYQGEEWAMSVTPVNISHNIQFWLAEAIPRHELLKGLIATRNQLIMTAGLLLIFCITIVWYMASRISRPLQNLSYSTYNIRRFNFKKVHYPKSMIKEVNDLTMSVELMEHTLHDLLLLLRDTAGNQEFSVLAKNITQQSFHITKADTIVLYTQDSSLKQLVTTANHAIIPFKININDLIHDNKEIEQDLKQGNIHHLKHDCDALLPHKEHLYNHELFLFPLLNRDDQLVGLLLVGYERACSDLQRDKHEYLREFLSFAEIAKDNIDKIQQQKEMLNAFISLIASAIDTKSPYTGGHCQRVPELTELLTKAAEQDQQYFPDFSLTEKEWEELHLASWLHDCGKVTTPEYVVDKATKLETIYDRIHEVRMRFEVMKLQAEIEYWQGVSQGKNPDDLKQELEQKHKQFDSDFAFIAECNIGGEYMDQEKRDRLTTLSKLTWKRTIDDQLGTSWVEQERYGTPTSLPTMEPLLADKDVHKEHWPNDISPKMMLDSKFTLPIPDLHYNRGELYNLQVVRGTLNEEERFVINNHIIQTIVMLEKLPYPEHLKNIPQIAGGHHEKMDGTGYPQGLLGSEQPLPARVMAIADIFEALTASDRPYKKSKNLEQSLKIMTSMAETCHIDPKLYLIFLEQKVFQVYADRFLNDDQKVEVDIEHHTKRVRVVIQNSPNVELG